VLIVQKSFFKYFLCKKQNEILWSDVCYVVQWRLIVRCFICILWLSSRSAYWIKVLRDQFKMREETAPIWTLRLCTSSTIHWLRDRHNLRFKTNQLSSNPSPSRSFTAALRQQRTLDAAQMGLIPTSHIKSGLSMCVIYPHNTIEVILPLLS